MQNMINRTVVPWLLGGMLATSAVFYGCSSTENRESESADGVGAVGLELQVTEGVALDKVNYIITGPGSFKRQGSVDVSKSNNLSARIDGIPLGAGYSLELSAAGRDGSATCTGSADFDMLAAGTNSLQVTLLCKLAPRKGALLVNGTINVCPVIDGIDASPLEVNVGGSIQLAATASDPDAGPSKLTYAWTASSGTLSSTSEPNPTFTCEKRGPATIALTVSDGDACPETRSVDVTCSGNTTPVTVSFQNGVSPSADYAGTDDATIREAAVSTNYGSAATCEADGDDGGVDKSCLLRWNVSAIPAGSKVQSASITLQVTSSTANTYDFYSVLRGWNEAEVTWQNASADALWGKPGALDATDRGISATTITGPTGSRTIELDANGIALVQSWINGGANQGLLVASTTNTDGVDFVSSEGTNPAQRPRLTVTYVESDGSEQAGISTDPNLKVAFIGDTDHGTNLAKVLELIVAEHAQALLVQGDMSYSANPTAWWDAVEAVVGPSFPIFISRGNHDDSSWPDYLPRAQNHLGGAQRVAGAHDANYKTTWRGLVVAAIRKGDKPENITPFFQDDPHIWKICQWHQNQEAMQVGGKSDEMGWGVYEACRELGAIIQTGHEHSYERTRTLINTATQTVDPTCSNPSELCVGPGRTFVNVVGLGGNSVRPQLRCLPTLFPYGCNQEWGFVYTSDQNATHGVQFITFNVNGKPNEATGYFKDIAGNVVDLFKVRAGAFQ